MMNIHIPVLLKEVLEIFDPQPGQAYIDATVNGGGHAEAILEKVGSKGKLLGIDRDCELIEKFERGFSTGSNDKYSSSEVEKLPNLILECGNYANIKSIARKYNLGKVNGILFDLGFSSHHLEESGRGFSFLKSEPLDMRYNSHEEIPTAAEIVNTWPRQAIEDILRKFGEERFARRIAEGIVRRRSVKKIAAADELARIIEQSIPGRVQRGRIHPATRTFQALRIAVNRELENLEDALGCSISILAPQGKLIVISFHSLEDRIVKRFLKDKEREEELAIVAKKPIMASEEEKKNNPRARSAKLRAAIKI